MNAPLKRNTKATSTKKPSPRRKKQPVAAQQRPKLTNGATRRRERLKKFRRLMRYEIANLMTHGIGVGLSIAGLVFLVTRDEPVMTSMKLVSFSIYGACMIMLYLSSTLYHSLWNPRAKKIFRVLDHSAIFLAIAGTYTPIALNVLPPVWGWSIFGAIWGIGLIGIAYKVFARKYRDFIDVSLYIAMGWLLIIAIKPTYEALTAAPLALIITGGGLYTGGTIFYALNRLPYNHMIWHLFVLGGSICHYIMLYLYV